MLVASGLVSSDAEAKAVAQRYPVNHLSPAALDRRIEALRLCGWNHAGFLKYDADRLIERAVMLGALGCALCSPPDVLAPARCGRCAVCSSVSLKLLSSLQDPM